MMDFPNFQGCIPYSQVNRPLTLPGTPVVGVSLVGGVVPCIKPHRFREHAGTPGASKFRGFSLRKTHQKIWQWWQCHTKNERREKRSTSPLCLVVSKRHSIFFCVLTYLTHSTIYPKIVFHEHFHQNFQWVPLLRYFHLFQWPGMARHLWWLDRNFRSTNQGTRPKKMGNGGFWMGLKGGRTWTKLGGCFRK